MDGARQGKLGQRDLWIGSPCPGTAGDSALATFLKPGGEGGGFSSSPSFSEAGETETEQSPEGDCWETEQCSAISEE